MLPKFTRRDAIILTIIGALMLGLAVMCPKWSMYQVSLTNPPGPFSGTVLTKQVLISQKRFFPVYYCIVVKDAAGHVRQIYVPFNDYAHAKPGQQITRDSSGRILIR